MYPRSVDESTRKKVAFAAREVQRLGADLIVVQQHLPSAAELARQTKVPIVFHSHNMSKAIPGTTPVGWLRRSRRLNYYRRLHGLIVVSQACQYQFSSNWPDAKIPVAVVSNGLDFSGWKPAEQRRNEIICVGRAAPEKGIQEAALAIEQVLTVHSNWMGRLLLAESNVHPQYMELIREIAIRSGGRIAVELGVPHTRVQQCCERAAIALVPSVWEEPFGRTGLEAHAGGCAVISSGTGGLAEIHGECALILPKSFSVSDISQRIAQLINDPDLRIRLARSGSMRVRERLSIASVSSRADNFYDRVLEQAYDNPKQFAAHNGDRGKSQVGLVSR